MTTFFVPPQGMGVLRQQYMLAGSFRRRAGREAPVPAPSVLAVRFESFVKGDGALRSVPVERQSEEDLLRHTL